MCKYTDIARQLQDYCYGKLVNAGLPMPSNGMSLFADSMQGDPMSNKRLSRTFLSKIHTILNKYLAKSSPVVDTLDKSLFQSGSNSDNILRMNIHSYKGELKVPEDQTISEYSYKISAGMQTPEEAAGESLTRYIKYVNYLCRKNRIPVEFSISSQVSVDGRCNNLISSNFPGYKYEGKLYGKIETILQVTHGNWECSNSRVYSAYASGENVSDKDFDQEHWLVRDVSHGRAGSHSAHIFKYYKEALKVIQTLSRKAAYGPKSFTFRH